MLTEERYAAILRILAEKKAVTVQELTRILDASESTVRRDLVALHKSGRLYKVYGGATSIDNNYSSSEEDMKTKRELHTEGKIAIARRAASPAAPRRSSARTISSTSTRARRRST
ncbi:DeoR family transcriptional regulator [Selenomonas bovis]|uniref:DeoR family transcriptional regulator n=1 Tax=Selenomonas bovis TaxID=416586 RepID=UPI003AB9A51A